MNKTPFIKLIRKYNLYYFYDVNTNEVVKISKELYELFEKESNSDIQTILSVLDDEKVKVEINKLLGYGFLSSNRPIINKHFLSDYIRIYQAGDLDKLTLQVTQNCNFKCRYCGYAGDGYLNRIHNTNTMSYDIAYRAVEFFLSHSFNSKELNVGFYGGEPLLEGELIQSVIKYIESKALGKKITYRITTNGSVADKRLLDFMENYNVHLMVSFDGPKRIQNKNRRYAINGRETYDTVEKNLNNLKDYYPNLYNKLSLHSVIDPSENYNDYIKFFTNNKHFIERSYSTSIIDDSKTIYKTKYSDKFVETDALNEMLYYYSKMYEKSNHVKSLYVHNYEKTSLNDKFARMPLLDENYHHGGACIPGVTRLFVDVKGEFYPCEKISENSECMKIGNVYKGFDNEKIQSQLNIVSLCGNDCSNCWAIRHCSICCNQVDNFNEFSLKIKKDICKRNMKSLLTDMEKFILLNEVTKNEKCSYRSL